VALGGRIGGSGNARRIRRISDRDDGLGFKTVIGLDDLVFFRRGWSISPKVPLWTKAKCALSNEFSINRSAAVFHLL